MQKSGSKSLDSASSKRQKARFQNAHDTDAIDSLSAPELARHWDFYLSLHCYDQSPKTKAGKAVMMQLLQGFMAARGLETFDEMTVVAFLDHVKNGHLEPGGRWGKGLENPRYLKPVRPRTPQLYYTYLQGFCRAMVDDGVLDRSPLERVRRPRCNPNDHPVVPFTDDQVTALLEAAAKSLHPERDVAILTLMFDGGLRAAEICGLQHQDLDLIGRRIYVRGKGNKVRLVPFGQVTARALLTFLRDARRNPPPPETPLFTCDRRHRGQPLQPVGLRQLFRRLGKAAGVDGVRCSPHTMRHAAATTMARNGMPQRAIMDQLGHSTPWMTLRYQRLTDAQLAEQHRLASPADKLLRKKR